MKVTLRGLILTLTYVFTFLKFINEIKWVGLATLFKRVYKESDQYIVGIQVLCIGPIRSIHIIRRFYLKGLVLDNPFIEEVIPKG